MDETLFARATTKRVAEEDWECDFDDMEDSFNLIDDESANEALWAGLSAKAKPRFVKRGPAYLDPLRREAVLAAARERYRRHKEQSGQCRPLCIGGGSGRLPTYEGSAAHFHIHPGLMGVNRLIWLTCMATRGAASAPFLTSLAGVYRANASAQLAGLQGRRAGEKPLGTVAAPFCRNAAQAVGNHRRRAQMAVARRLGHQPRAVPGRPPLPAAQ